MPRSPKVWFITGSSTGFGRYTVECALRNGDKVVATLRKPEALATLSALHSLDQLLVLKLDVTQPQEILDVFAAAGKHFGRIDVVFNNAGVALLGEAEGVSEDTARRLFDVNYWGAVNVSKEAVRFFRDENIPAGGTLLQNSSVLGLSGSSSLSTYCGAKHALEGFSAALALELDPAWNIKLVVVEPGWFRTDILAPGNMQRTPLHPSYNKPSSPVVAFHNHIDGNPLVRGDVVKAVDVIYKLAALNDPPLHFPLGIDCVETMRAQGAEMVAIADRYKSWSDGLDAE